MSDSSSPLRQRNRNERRALARGGRTVLKIRECSQRELTLQHSRTTESHAVQSVSLRVMDMSDDVADRHKKNVKRKLADQKGSASVSFNELFVKQQENKSNLMLRRT